MCPTPFSRVFSPGRFPLVGLLLLETGLALGLLLGAILGPGGVALPWAWAASYVAMLGSGVLRPRGRSLPRLIGGGALLLLALIVMGGLGETRYFLGLPLLALPLVARAIRLAPSPIGRLSLWVVYACGLLLIVSLVAHRVDAGRALPPNAFPTGEHLGDPAPSQIPDTSWAVSYARLKDGFHALAPAPTHGFPPPGKLQSGSLLLDLSLALGATTMSLILAGALLLTLSLAVGRRFWAPLDLFWILLLGLVLTPTALHAWHLAIIALITALALALNHIHQNHFANTSEKRWKD